MKLGGSLGNVPQKLKNAYYKNSIYFGLLVRFKREKNIQGKDQQSEI
jgi:hypothetical protein